VTRTPARHRAERRHAEPEPDPGRGRRRRAGYLLGSLLAVAALTVGGLALAHGSGGRPASSALVTPASRAASPVAVGPINVSPIGVGTATVPASARAKRPARGSSGSPSPSRPAPSTSVPAAAQEGTPAAEVLALINQARAAAGLPPLTVIAGLVASASAHNLRMAGGCGLSHQCPGEPGLGARETAAGVVWTVAGENIGEEGPVPDTTAAIAQTAVSLTQDMLNETPPNDGHRLNILSASFTHVGIAVYRDSSGTVWLTQDFAN
jgi:uncharacterized protein YkwD